MSGWVKLHRSFLEFDWYDDPNVVRVLLHLILTCNYEAKQWRGIDIQAGQIVTSYDKLAEALSLSPKQIRLALDKLEKGREIERNRAGKGQLVTLVKWAKFQQDDNQEGRKRAGKKEDEGQKEGRKRATTKEGEEIEESKEETIYPLNPPKGEEVVLPFNSENFKAQWQLWKAYKKKQHRFTYKHEASEQAALTSLNNMATGQESKAIQILHHTMANGWKGFVVPKDEGTSTKMTVEDILNGVN
jgi:hypothetical protein